MELPLIGFLGSSSQRTLRRAGIRPILPAAILVFEPVFVQLG
jgi:hypothetical protein